MENVKSIRKRINKKENIILNVLNIVFVMLSIILGVLIYMKKDQNASFLKNNFNVNTSFIETNKTLDNFLDSLFSFRLKNNSSSKTVSNNVIYLPCEEKINFFTCESNLIPSLKYGIVYFVEKNDSGNYSILIDYQDYYAAYYNVIDPKVKVYDRINKGDYIGSYDQDFKVLFKKDGKLTSYYNL